MSSVGLSVHKIPQNPKERLDSAFKTESPKLLPKLKIPQWYEPKAWLPQPIQDISKKLSVAKESNNYEGNIKDTIKSFEDAQSTAHKTMLGFPILAGMMTAIPFLPTLPLLSIGMLGGVTGHIAKKIYDHKKLTYLGEEYDRRTEALENDPIAKLITKAAIKSSPKTDSNDFSKIIKKYNKNNKIAQEKHKKDMLNIFIPYKKQEDSQFYEANLAGRDPTYYNDIIPETSNSDVTPKHFSWLANNGTNAAPPIVYNAAQDLNGMRPADTGVFVNDDKSNRKAAFMIKIMKKYGLDIKNADSVENFHKIDSNNLNYKRALRLFKADNCPAKDQFKKIRDIIKEKYTSFNKEDASLSEKEKYFKDNIVNVMITEAQNNNANPEFMKTLRAICVAEWLNIKKHHPSTS